MKVTFEKEALLWLYRQSRGHGTSGTNAAALGSWVRWVLHEDRTSIFLRGVVCEDVVIEMVAVEAAVGAAEIYPDCSTIFQSGVSKKDVALKSCDLPKGGLRWHECRYSYCPSSPGQVVEESVIPDCCLLAGREEAQASSPPGGDCVVDEVATGYRVVLCADGIDGTFVVAYEFGILDPKDGVGYRRYGIAVILKMAILDCEIHSRNGLNAPIIPIVVEFTTLYLQGVIPGATNTERTVVESAIDHTQTAI